MLSRAASARHDPAPCAWFGREVPRLPLLNYGVVLRWLGVTEILLLLEACEAELRKWSD